MTEKEIIATTFEDIPHTESEKWLIKKICGKLDFNFAFLRVNRKKI